ncbi:potassium inwardly-rectifying channel subfamily J member 1 [Sarotherodon galilaeus]
MCRITTTGGSRQCRPEPVESRNHLKSLISLSLERVTKPFLRLWDSSDHSESHYTQMKKTVGNLSIRGQLTKITPRRHQRLMQELTKEARTRSKEIPAYGWKQHGGNCYYFSTRKSSWDVSRTECRTKGGDLVKIDSSEEQSFLKTKIEYGGYFWIGLTDSAEEGKWLWVDGSPLNERLASWSFREPDDRNGEDCVKMEQMYWFDNSCKVNHRSICEKPAVVLCD